MASLKDKLITPIAPPATKPHSKVTVVGVGQVGMACAISVLEKVILLPQRKVVMVNRPVDGKGSVAFGKGANSL